MMEKLQNEKWPKIGLLAVTSLLLAGGLVFAGIQINKRQVPPLPRSLVPLATTTVPTRPSVFIPILQPEPSLLPDETARWETYTNAESKISFKYPQWQAQPIAEGNLALNGPQGETFMFLSGPPMNECMEKTESSSIFVGGLPFAKSTFVGVGPESSLMCGQENLEKKEIWVVSNSEKYSLVLRYSKQSASKAEKTLEQILSTFKFLD